MSNQNSRLGEIISLLKENKMNELDFSDGTEKIKVKCKYQEPRPSVQIKQLGQEEKAPEKKEKPETQIYTARSKLVGYFHAVKKEKESKEEMKGILGIVSRFIQPKKDYEPYVRAGQQVCLDDVLGTIEAMKLLNEIKLADYKDFQEKYAVKQAVIEKILVEDGMPVEYGTPLFQLRPVSGMARQ